MDWKSFLEQLLKDFRVDNVRKELDEIGLNHFID